MIAQGSTTAAAVAEILEKENALARQIREASRAAEARLAVLEDNITTAVSSAAADGARQGAAARAAALDQVEQEADILFQEARQKAAQLSARQAELVQPLVNEALGILLAAGEPLFR